jgi:hypothetical protein
VGLCIFNSLQPVCLIFAENPFSDRLGDMMQPIERNTNMDIGPTELIIILLIVLLLSASGASASWAASWAAASAPSARV